MKRARPLSPHLQIYKWHWTMFYSILHRGTGVLLWVGALLAVLLFASMVYCPSFFSSALAALHTPLGRVFLLLGLWVLVYHLLGEVRHLVWDAGYGFDLQTARWSGHILFALSFVVTLFAVHVGRLF